MIEYRLWTTEHEEILVRYGDSPEISHKLLRENVRLPEGMAYEDLLASDEFFILVKLRADSLCPYFTYKTQCHKCEKPYTAQANLQQLSIIDSGEAADEPFPCFLPHAKIEILLRYPRVRDGDALQEIADKLGEEGLLRYQYAKQIVKVDGESLKWDEVKDFVTRMAWGDSRAIQMVLADNHIGHDMRDESKCRNCGAVNVTAIELDASFFRPSRPDIATAVRVAQESRG